MIKDVPPKLVNFNSGFTLKQKCENALQFAV